MQRTGRNRWPTWSAVDQVKNNTDTQHADHWNACTHTAAPRSAWCSSSCCVPELLAPPGDTLSVSLRLACDCRSMSLKPVVTYWTKEAFLLPLPLFIQQITWTMFCFFCSHPSVCDFRTLHFPWQVLHLGLQLGLLVLKLKQSSSANPSTTLSAKLHMYSCVPAWKMTLVQYRYFFYQYTKSSRLFANSRFSHSDNTFFLNFFFTNCIVPLGFLPWEI